MAPVNLQPVDVTVLLQCTAKPRNSGSSIYLGVKYVSCGAYNAYPCQRAIHIAPQS